jgi:hypothetical protein
LNRTESFRDADAFLENAKQTDPERYAELEKRYPTLTARDYLRSRLGKTITRAKKERVTAEGDHPVVGKKRRWLEEQDWSDYQRNRKRYIEEWEDEYYRAKELADQGM